MLDYEQVAADELYEWFLTTLAAPKKTALIEVLPQ